MAIIKCKMCGGELEIEPGATVGTCEYCGSKQTLPRLDDERKANLYDRANHFRRNNEFDKASSVYERLLSEDPEDAEAYWSLVLCRYGIEYVEDPATHKRVPTVNRAQYTSIFDDDNYKQAIAHADVQQKAVYEEEAKAINEIQKGILAISQKEDPFDVFICYKETDNNGRRTMDSVLANDLYHQLTNEGFKVFFSRITLEDKLGVAYEPYIFAALNSAKVMVVLGTKPEYFNAVWVKNEWSRYLSIVKQSGGKKVLIPAYRDMDPYDLPEEFSHLQAQDMSKLGFMQDLIRGIKKILEKDKAPAVSPVISAAPQNASVSGNANVRNLLKRARLFLEDEDFDAAREYADKILDEDAECAEAYMIKVLAVQKCCSEQELEMYRADEDLLDDPDMRKAIRFAQDGTEYTRIANRVAENAAFLRLILRYLVISLKADNGVTENAASARDILQHRLDSEDTENIGGETYEKAAKQLKAMGAYPMAAECAALCEKLAAIGPNVDLYKYLTAQMKDLQGSDDWKTFKEISAELANLGSLRDSAEKSTQAAKTAEEIVQRLYQVGMDMMKKAATLQENDAGIEIIRQLASEISIDEAEQFYAQRKIEIAAALKAAKERREVERQKAVEEAAAAAAAKKRRTIITAVAIAVIAAAIAVYSFVLQPMMKYNSAKALLDSGKYAEAYTAFLGMKGYKDVDTLLSTDDNLIAAARDAAWQPGNYVTFGTYPQTKAGTDSTPIEWLVLDRDGSNALVISRYGLDVKRYNTEYVNMTWEKCSLRSWLNGTFMNNAFTQQEQAAILTTNVDNSKSQGYSGYNTNGGNNTQDQIFLLSYAEANKYFGVHYSVSGSKNNTKSRVEPTAYAIAQDACTSSKNKTADGAAAGWWWLRSPGSSQSFAAFIERDGSLAILNVNASSCCVRPALWINLDS